MARIVLIAGFLIHIFSANAEINGSFGFRTSYLEAEFTKEVKIYPDISAALKDSLTAEAVKISAAGQNLKKVHKLRSIKCIYLDATFALDDYYINKTNLELFFTNISTLPQLHYISIHDIRLLPYLKNCKHLKGLKLEVYDESIVKNCLPFLSELEIVILNDPSINTWPGSLSRLKKLRQLEINCVNMNSLSEDFGNFSDLVVLKMLCGKLTALPASFGGLSKLKYLSLRGLMAFQTFPLEICKLASLTELVMELKMISPLPEELALLSELKVLELHESRKITSLPASFPRLLNLEMLYLGDVNPGIKFEILQKMQYPFVLVLNRADYLVAADQLRKVSKINGVIIPSSTSPDVVKKMKKYMGEDRILLKGM